MAYQNQNLYQQQPQHTNDEYVAPRAVICNELCYGCSTKRFAVAIRATVCILTLGITEALRGKDGWCAPCLEIPVAPPPQRSPSRSMYVNQQPIPPAPMEVSIPMTTATGTVTSNTQPTQPQGGLPQHSARQPSYGHVSLPPDSLNYSYVQQQPQPQQPQDFAETQQQPLPQFQPPNQPDQQTYSEFQQQQEMDQLQYQQDLQQQQQQQQHQHHQSQEYTEHQQQPSQVPHSPQSPPPQANHQLPWQQQQQQQQPPIRINSPVYQQTISPNMASNMSPNMAHNMTTSTDPNPMAHIMVPNMTPNGPPNMAPIMMAPNMVLNSHSGNGATGSPGPHQLSAIATPPASVTSTPGRKPVNIVISPQAIYTPPQDVYVQPVLHIKPKVKRRDSSSSDSS
ncbi:hypothetical protein AJ78_05276 [Emergomyces pasteurianus Ep9510]|uniref:Uncharacterized protein n=1 Tax=Emergomyces pasteurianus Ep9510 TaxID=1447872 RepID=A0A1J9Q2F4_9EURO|nr:hypothetical protein AJ78_05276 [Emergomyces pasteurianus Ep9510]